MQKSYKTACRLTLLALACATGAAAVRAGDAPYAVQAGDVLQVSVWKEADLQAEVLVRPDGGISFPLAGEIAAAGHSIEDIRSQIDQRLRKYIPDPVVTVALKAIGGNRIYVLGKVNKPGDFPLGRPLDVMQALSLAGGATPYADLNDIQILRREGDKQVAIVFSYGDVERGRRLTQNVLLQSGDTVVVP
ncbi:MAG TPA: polysaccharide biosynthesis/export family protein [Dyella sp.]|uniref:polysaccharide biosynthesis/export family protein n=1 Tax=Dyella sp. TaxID=1869338 RepID=UPI002D7A2EC5|nr:polysaccharide biosynthesis/export family protein [Dyella sp.]HET6553610.1 polysaccharide biosynthesis/export family protein [Dyella sp.]